MLYRIKVHIRIYSGVNYMKNKTIVGIVLLMSISLLQAGPQFAFKEAYLFPDTVAHYNFIVTDMNKDGYQDIFAYSNDTAYWLENDTHGKFKGQNNVEILHPGQKGHVSELYLEDLDLDGDPDILSVQQWREPDIPLQLYWSRNNGAGNFNKMTSINLPDIRKHSEISLLDLDNDNDIDIFIESDGLGWLENIDGKGTYSEYQALPKIDSSYLIDTPLLVDFEGDGDLDVLLRSFDIFDGLGDFKYILIKNISGFKKFNIENMNKVDDQTIQVEHDETQRSSWSNKIKRDENERERLIPTNLDGDSNLDIFGYGTSYIYWYEFRVSEKIEFIERTFSHPLDIICPPITIDFDLDGDQDFFMFSYHNGFYSQLAWLENLDSGKRFKKHYIGFDEKANTDSQKLYGPVRVIDMNNDGQLDIVGMRQISDKTKLFVYTNKKGRFKFWSDKRSIEAKIIDITDINNDGKSDVLMNDSAGLYYYQNKYVNDRFKFLLIFILFAVFYIPFLLMSRKKTDRNKMTYKAKVLMINIANVLTRREVEEALSKYGIIVKDFAVIHSDVKDNPEAISKATTKYMKDHPDWHPYNKTITLEYSDGTKSHACLFDMEPNKDK